LGKAKDAVAAEDSRPKKARRSAAGIRKFIKKNRNTL